MQDWRDPAYVPLEASCAGESLWDLEKDVHTPKALSRDTTYLTCVTSNWTWTSILTRPSLRSTLHWCDNLKDIWALERSCAFFSRRVSPPPKWSVVRWGEMTCTLLKDGPDRTFIVHDPRRAQVFELATTPTHLTFYSYLSLFWTSAQHAGLARPSICTSREASHVGESLWDLEKDVCASKSSWKSNLHNAVCWLVHLKLCEVDHKNVWLAFYWQTSGSF